MKKYSKAAGFILPVLMLTALSCEKKNEEQVYREPYEKELRFHHNNIDSVRVPVVKKFAKDKACTHIYLTVIDNNNFTGWDADDITILRNLLQKDIELAPEKTSGRGSFNAKSGVIRPADSLWFVEHGWTWNMYQH